MRYMLAVFALFLASVVLANPPQPRPQPPAPQPAPQPLPFVPPQTQARTSVSVVTPGFGYYGVPYAAPYAYPAYPYPAGPYLSLGFGFGLPALQITRQVYSYQAPQQPQQQPPQQPQQSQRRGKYGR